MTSLATSSEQLNTAPAEQLDRLQCLEQCYALAIRSAADYALDFDSSLIKEFQKHVHALEERVQGEASTEALRSIQASFRGELRDYRDKVQVYIQRLKSDLEGATEMMKTFATTFVANGADVEQKVRGELHNLEHAAESDDIGKLRESVRSATQEISRSYDELNKANQLVIAELQHEIRLLHREMESERRAAWTDAESGAWVKRKIDDRIEDLLKAADPFCVIVILVQNLKRLEMQCSKTLVSGALGALVKRCYGVVGEGTVVARLSEDKFAAVIEVESRAAHAIAHELGERLSNRYSVQENGIAQNISLRITCGAVDRARSGDATEFHRRLHQMTGVDHTPLPAGTE
jgi:GGDEF domain-containing protein